MAVFRGEGVTSTWVSSGAINTGTAVYVNGARVRRCTSAQLGSGIGIALTSGTNGGYITIMHNGLARVLVTGVCPPGAPLIPTGSGKLRTATKSQSIQGTGAAHLNLRAVMGYAVTSGANGYLTMKVTR